MSELNRPSKACKIYKKTYTRNFNQDFEFISFFLNFVASSAHDASNSYCDELLWLLDLPAFCADLVEVCHVGNGPESVAESLLNFFHVAHPARQRYTIIQRNKGAHSECVMSGATTFRRIRSFEATSGGVG